jgi:hypothetical protein
MDGMAGAAMPFVKTLILVRVVVAGMPSLLGTLPAHLRTTKRGRAELDEKSQLKWTVGAVVVVALVHTTGLNETIGTTRPR